MHGGLNLSVPPLRSLCVSVVNLNFHHTQFPNVTDQPTTGGLASRVRTKLGYLSKEITLKPPRQSLSRNELLT
jgi:hypothetical protein